MVEFAGGDVPFPDSLVGGFDGHLVALAAFGERFQFNPAFGHVTDDLYDCGDLAVFVREGRCRRPHEQPAPLAEERERQFHHDAVFSLLKKTVPRGRDDGRVAQQVAQNGDALTVERQGIFVVALAYHVGRGDAREFFHGPVPCHQPSCGIDHERGIGVEVDDVGQVAACLA